MLEDFVRGLCCVDSTNILALTLRLYSKKNIESWRPSKAQGSRIIVVGYSRVEFTTGCSYIC